MKFYCIESYNYTRNDNGDLIGESVTTHGIFSYTESGKAAARILERSLEEIYPTVCTTERDFISDIDSSKVEE